MDSLNGPAEGPLKWYKYFLSPWIAIVGMVITVFGNIGAIIELSGWARWLIRNWQYYTHAVWDGLAHIFGLSVSSEMAATANSIVFALSIIFGAYRESKPEDISGELYISSSDVWFKHYAFCFALTLLIFPLGIYYTYKSYHRRLRYYNISIKRSYETITPYFMLPFIFLFFLPIMAQQTNPASDDKLKSYWFGAFLFTAISVGISGTFVSYVVVIRRFVYVGIGVAILIGFSVLSEMNIDLKPPI